MVKTTIIFCFFVLPLIINAAYDKFFWKDLGSNAIRIDAMTLTPMPILLPGTGLFSMKGEAYRTLSGPIKTKVDVIRSVSGISLKISCTYAELPNGNQIKAGSCTHDDLCAIVPIIPSLPYGPAVQLNSVDCPLKFVKGPFDISNTFEFLDPTITLFQNLLYLVNGDFNVTIETNDSIGQVAKIQLGYTVSKAKV